MPYGKDMSVVLYRLHFNFPFSIFPDEDLQQEMEMQIKSQIMYVVCWLYVNA